MGRTKEPPVPSCYVVLHVHPAAPQDLITAAYWKLTGLLRASLASDKGAEVALYNLTRAYQVLADHQSREAYDQSLGLRIQPLPRVPLRRRSSWLSFGARAPKAEADARIDYYELMRLDPRAHPAIVPEAYSVMRNYYLRLAEEGQARPELVDLLEEAYGVLSDPEQRQEYDGRLGGRSATQTDDSGFNGGANTSADDDDAGLPTVGSEGKVSPSAKETPATYQTASRQAQIADGSPIVNAESAGKAEDGEGEVKDSTEAPLNGQGLEAQPGSEPAGDENGVRPAPGARSRLIKSLLASSGGLLVKSGRESGRLALGATRTLRAVIDGRSRSDGGVVPSDEEEEAVLARVFVSASEKPSAEKADCARVLGYLIVSQGQSAGATYEVRKVPLTLGEDDGCDIKLPGLAPWQARLLHHGGQYVIHALTEEPTIRVEGNPVSWALLRDGDSVEVGLHRLRFSLEARAPTLANDI